jgi:Flagellar biosynthesis protein, FliO
VDRGLDDQQLKKRPFNEFDEGVRDRGVRVSRNIKSPMHADLGGIAGWVMARFRNAGKKSTPRLALLERIALGPRQSLALVEAEGRCFLVATSAEGGPVFYALDDSVRAKQSRAARPALSGPARLSW